MSGSAATTQSIRREWGSTGAPGVSTLEARGLVAEEHLLGLCDEIERLRAALERIKTNAESWHGPNIYGQQDALNVIAGWAKEALS